MYKCRFNGWNECYHDDGLILENVTFKAFGLNLISISNGVSLI